MVNMVLRESPGSVNSCVRPEHYELHIPLQQGGHGVRARHGQSRESLPEKCSNCFKALRSDLKFSRNPATPYMPRLRSPLRDSGCSDAWIVEALGDSDFYGHARLFGGALDIGPAEYDAAGERGLSVFSR